MSLPNIPHEPEEQVLWSTSSPGSGVSFLSRCAVPLLAFLTAAMLGLGISMISSATIFKSGNHYFWMQLVWVGCGLVACLTALLLNLPKLYRLSHWGLLAIMLPLGYLTAAAVAMKLVGAKALHFFPCAAAIKGAVRWLRFGGIQIQPSEFAKIALVLFLAAYYGMIPRKKIKSFLHGVVIPLGSSCILLGLVLLGKDLSTTFVTGMMVIGVMFLAGVRFRYMLMILVIGAVVGTAFIAGSPMRRDRITAWKHPEENRLSESYQLFRSQICLGQGNLFGKGYSKGYVKTYLPEAHTDFIVAVIGEELGFVGITGILLGYLGLCACILVISHQCRTRSDLLLCHGIAILIAVQALVNVGVVSGWLPPTGVTAPFLSYGGSSVISLMFLLGLVFNVSRRNAKAIWSEIGTQRILPRNTDRPLPKRPVNAFAADLNDSTKTQS